MHGPPLKPRFEYRTQCRDEMDMDDVRRMSQSGPRPIRVFVSNSSYTVSDVRKRPHGRPPAPRDMSRRDVCVPLLFFASSANVAKPFFQGRFGFVFLIRLPKGATIILPVAQM